MSLRVMEEREFSVCSVDREGLPHVGLCPKRLQDDRKNRCPFAVLQAGDDVPGGSPSPRVYECSSTHRFRQTSLDPQVNLGFTLARVPDRFTGVKDGVIVPRLSAPRKLTKG